MTTFDEKNKLLGTDNVILWEDNTTPEEFMSESEESHSEFAKLFEQSCEDLGDIKEGKIISGKITKITGEAVVVDIGHKTDGEIPSYEFKNEDKAVEIAVGDDIDIFLETFENKDGQLVLSFEKAQLMKAWDNLVDAFENEKVVSGKIIRPVKGGLHVDIGVRAFLPGSQIDLKPIKNLDDLVGQEFEYKIIKFNKARSNVVLSRRVLLEHDREKTKMETIRNLKEGMVVSGIVKNLTDYGAFIDLGGVDGLLHITDMSWGRVSHPSQIFEVGQEADVIVLGYDEKSLRVSLGYKQLKEDPWKKAVEKYQANTRTHGLVVSLMDYGAFVELEDGIEGLIHISEM
ncbi:MAG: S1 RNA-binding domain-containing protein, partial [Proteobacteria bacterium]|nr:S1 RNA-binding domain-containing protein [Pseudomonadota bacterium]